MKKLFDNALLCLWRALMYAPVMLTLGALLPGGGQLKCGLSFGFACSIGDQLEPCGRLNPATYRLIGKVYGPFAAREQWARPSAPLTEVALMTAESDMGESRMTNAIMGAAQLLEELAVQFDILDRS